MLEFLICLSFRYDGFKISNLLSTSVLNLVGNVCCASHLSFLYVLDVRHEFMARCLTVTNDRTFYSSLSTHNLIMHVSFGSKVQPAFQTQILILA